ncbi:MAG: nicotinamide-nucleotide amidohydrolase family protein [Spirochaetales bacterium]|nr:nicotinamide-nucleotide amidohydrolase family protein [Spirochaetales bacterium]
MNYTRAALFIIGTELTRGVISDRNGRLLGSQLTQLGYRVERIILLPDDGSVADHLKECVNTCDVVLVTGGLGPTSDDRTRSIIADLAGVDLVRDSLAFEALYRRMGERIRGANEQQTMIPEGFEMIPNPNGTACGFRGFVRVEDRDVLVVALPGPPREMDRMFFDSVRPLLGELSGHDDFERSDYSTYLLAESKLEELCRSVAADGLEWGTRFQEQTISLYIAGGNQEKRTAMVERLRSLVGPLLIVDGDVQPVELLIGELKERGESIATAESISAGLVSKLLTDQSGSSAWYWGGVNAYANEAKVRLLGVKEETIAGFGAVSVQCAAEMAEGMLRQSSADWALSVTGIAGPSGGSEEKPVGTVCFGFASRTRSTQSVQVRLTAHSRDIIRRRAATVAFLLAARYMQGGRLLDTVKKWQYS